MSTSTFDPSTFLNTTTDEALDTNIIPCPVGEYPAISDKVDVKSWSSSDGSSSGLKVIIMWDIQDENAKQVAQRDPLRVKQEQMLDLTDTGQLDLGKGKNIGLGRIREALGLNTPGEPFALSMIAGRQALVTVSHRPDKNDPERLYDEIKKIAKL